MPGAASYAVVRDLAASGRFGELVTRAPSGSPGTTVPGPAQDLVFYRVTGSDGVTRQMVFDPSLNKDRPITIDEWQKASGGPAGQRIETTSRDTYYYGPANVMDSSDKRGTVQTDPTHQATNATLDYMSVQRDLVRAGLKP